MLATSTATLSGRRHDQQRALSRRSGTCAMHAPVGRLCSGQARSTSTVTGTWSLRVAPGVTHPSKGAMSTERIAATRFAGRKTMSMWNRVGDPGRVTEHRVGHHPIRPGQIKRRPLDALAPVDGPFGEPCADRFSVRARHHVEQLAPGEVDDLGRPASVSELAEPAEQHFMGSNSGRCSNPIGDLDQPAAVSHDGAHRVCQSQPRSFAALTLSGRDGRPEPSPTCRPDR